MSDNDARQQLDHERRGSATLLQAVVTMGVGLLAERNFDRLLRAILLQSKSLGIADGGTLYLRTEDDHLELVVLHNDSLGLALGRGTGEPIPCAPLALYDRTGVPNHTDVATHVALTGDSVNVPDAYGADGFEFPGTLAFDRRIGYRSISSLGVPLKNWQDRVIGVLQLLNARAPDGRIVAFDTDRQSLVESFCRLATAALEAFEREDHLRRRIEELHIQIDDTKKARRAAAIAETNYFQQLLRKARELRHKG